MKRILIVAFFINFLTTFGFSQIQVGGNQPKEKKEKGEKKAKKKPMMNDSTDFGLNLFLGATFANTFRKLEPNKNELFADSLGSRSNETKRFATSFQLGFTSDISEYFMWEAGVSYLQNGEKYSFKDVDTSHTYDSKYSWIGVPIKVHFKYEINKIRLQVGGGIIAQMQMKFRQNEVFINSEGTETTNTVKTNIGMNNFGLSAIGNVGIHYSITKRFGAYVLYEYRHQLTSSYLKLNSYSHKGTSSGVNIGLTFGL